MPRRRHRQCLRCRRLKTYSVDIAQARTQLLFKRTSAAESHTAGIVEILRSDLYLTILNKLHNTVHSHVRKCKTDFRHHISLHDFRVFNGKTGSLAVRRYESGSAEFDTAEIADDNNHYVCDAERVDLPQDRFSCGAGRLAVVAAEKVFSFGAKHIRPAHVPGVVVFLLIACDDLLGIGSR